MSGGGNFVFTAQLGAVAYILYRMTISVRDLASLASCWALAAMRSASAAVCWVALLRVAMAMFIWSAPMHCSVLAVLISRMRWLTSSISGTMLPSTVVMDSKSAMVASAVVQCLQMSLVSAEPDDPFRGPPR